MTFSIRSVSLMDFSVAFLAKYQRLTTSCNAFMETQKRLTLEGNIVISVGLFGHSGDDEVWTEGTKEMLDDMQNSKIIFVRGTVS